MDTITINELEVFFRVGVPDEERADPQRLLITIEMEKDFRAAADGDDLTKTIDYFAVSQAVKALGNTRCWKLIEKLASDIAVFVLAEFAPDSVSVEVKKFILPDTRHVSVKVKRRR